MGDGTGEAVPAGRRPLPLREALSLLSWPERVATVRAGLLVSAVELGVRAIPISRLGRLLGVPLDLGPSSASVGAEAQTARDDLWERLASEEQRGVEAVARVLRRWPFGDGRCLRRSLAVGHVLRRRQPVMRIGVASEDGDLLAHAWIEVAGVAVGDDPRYLPFEATR